MASTRQAQCILALFLVLAVWTYQVMSRNLHDASLTQRHEEWIAKYGKVYMDAAEKERRFKTFKDNVEFIESFNAAANRPYKLSINEFADQTKEEFKDSRNGYRKPHVLRSRRRSII
ncbi:Senescence-specific cysteine protease [Fagus crenata]